MASAQGISTPVPPLNRGTMVALPTNLTSLSALLIILGDVLIFLLIALAFRLLSPRKLTGAIWVSPVFHMYTLFAAALAVYEEAPSSEPWSSLAAVMAAFGVAAVLGAFLGRYVGRRIPVSPHADGHTFFTGGKLLVTLLVLLLLPLALEQAALLFGAIAGVQSLIQAMSGAPPFGDILAAVGSLFVLGTVMSVTWRFEVWGKRPGASPRAAPSK